MILLSLELSVDSSISGLLRNSRKKILMVKKYTYIHGFAGESKIKFEFKDPPDILHLSAQGGAKP